MCRVKSNNSDDELITATFTKYWQLAKYGI